MPAVSSERLNENKSLVKSIADDDQFLSVLGNSLGSVGAKDVAESLSNMVDSSMKDLFHNAQTAFTPYTPSRAQQKIKSAGKRIGESEISTPIKKKPRDAFSTQEPEEQQEEANIPPEEKIPEKEFPQEEGKEGEKGEKEEEGEEGEEGEEEKKPFEPFTENLPETEDLPVDKRKRFEEEPEQEKQEKQRKQAIALETEKQQTRKGLNTQKAQEKETEEQKMKKEKEESGKQFTNIELLFWLFLAALTDIGSLIPWIGVIFSWPFAVLFFIFKWKKKFKRSTTVAVSVADLLIEGMFSTFPINIADVLITHLLAKTKKLEKAIGIKKE